MHELYHSTKHLSIVAFISGASHKNFIEQCKELADADQSEELNVQKSTRLKDDINELEQLHQQYLLIMAQIPDLTARYNVLQRRVRVTARKLKTLKQGHIVKSRRLHG